MRIQSFRRDIRSANLSQGARRKDRQLTEKELRYSNLSQSYVERKTLTERHFLSISFQGIRDRDPLNIQDRYRKKQRANDNQSHLVLAHANEKYLVRFYTCFTMIPIFLILGTLFYSFWYLSPKSQNLRIYQQDIFEWNEAHMAKLMEKLDFEYEITPHVT